MPLCSRSAATLLAFLLCAGGFSGQVPSPIVERRIAITIDDLPTVSVTDSGIAEAERITRELVAALGRNQVPAIGFVNERKLRPGGSLDERRVALLRRWIDAGLELGNHTFSHLDLHRVSIEAFERDIVAGEAVTRPLLAQAGRQLRYFRHPFLHTGRSDDTRRRLESFLGQRGYVVAPVTVDNSDYLFAAAYDRAAAAADTETGRKVVASYLEYMEAVVTYYEQQSVAIAGREIAQTLLLHANALNAATFDRLAAMLKRRGYRFVGLGDALTDPAYGAADSYVGPAGITWLHRWALTQGKKGALFAGEPEVPEWVERYGR